LAAEKPDLILCPSYQRSESAERICILSQVRALDTGAYLIRSSYAVSGADTGGNSLAASPDGSLLVNAESNAGIVSIEIDPKAKFIKPASHGQPLIEHRQLLDSYRRL
ncbi:MAG: hypothetical protein ACYTFY_19270, partial [Planctomycetota bacterium]